MGFYTQVRGWLNVDSISTSSHVELQRHLFEVRRAFKETNVPRSWVSEDTCITLGANGSKFIFIGTEMKNYDDVAEEWIKFLLPYFPNAEGRIDFQTEREEPGETTSKYWLIYKGEIVEEGRCVTWCKGYGNTAGDNE